MKCVWRILKTLIWLAVIGGVAFLGFKLYDLVRRDYLYPVKYEKYVAQYAEEYGLEEALVYAVIRVESSFDPAAESTAGALGLMQMMPETYRDLCELTGEEYDPAALHRPQTAIRYGCLYLSRLKNRFTNEPEMLAAYNAGEGKVSAWLQDGTLAENGRLYQDKIPIEETRTYVERVLSTKQEYLSLYGEEKEWQ